MSSEKVSGSSVRDFYSGKTVFLTGVTGTVGKIVLERLFRYCNSVQTVYVLIRPSRDSDAESRLKDLLLTEIFKTACDKNNYVDHDKIIAVRGDLEKPGLGLTEALKKLLIDEVEIVIHCGANVKFNLPINDAIRVNCGGSRNLMALFGGSKRLVSYVHVSTVFLKTDQRLEETVQEVSAEVLKDSDDRFGNTYIISKLISENEVHKARFQMPIAIARLPIVGACHREPIPGYVDAPHANTGFMMAIASGVQPYSYVSVNCRSQIVPAEVCANFLITVAWARGTSLSQEALVYNLASDNPPLLRDIRGWWNETFPKYPVKNMLWYPTFRTVESWTLLKILRVLFVYLPALVLDFFNILQNQVPGITKTQFITDRNIDQFAHFNRRNWDISMENTLKLVDSLQGQDRLNFPITPKIDWKEYIESHYRGIRKYCLRIGDEVDCKPALQMAFYREIFRMMLVPVILLVLSLLARTYIGNCRIVE